MFAKDIKVGIKVVPVIKTFEGPLGKSETWNTAKEQGKEFLWVINIKEEAGRQPIYQCGLTRNATEGDWFASIDLRAFPWEGWKSRGPDHTERRSMKEIQELARDRANARALERAEKARKKAEAKAELERQLAEAEATPGPMKPKKAKKAKAEEVATPKPKKAKAVKKVKAEAQEGEAPTPVAKKKIKKVGHPKVGEAELVGSDELGSSVEEEFPPVE